MCNCNVVFLFCLHCLSGFQVDGYEESPLIHLCLSDFRGSREAGQKLLDTIVKESLEEGVAIVTAKYLESEEHKLPQQRY